MKKISYPMGQHTLHDFSMTFVILIELQKEKAIKSFCVSKNRIEIELSNDNMNKLQKITSDDISELMKLLCRKGTYVSLFIDIHDGEIKQIDNRWKSRGKDEIADFIKKFGKKDEN